jgi:FAD/FMN-containing dehydrogenase
MQLQSWGLARASAQELWTPANQTAAARLARHAWAARGGWVAHGAGRSYADSALPAAGASAMNLSGMRHVVSFDRQTGVIEVEAGATLGFIQALGLESGWGLPVMPGTALATVAGALANDVHGKNHGTAGCFSRSVISLTMARSDRGVFVLDRAQGPMWRATVGGLGATGLMLSIRIQLERWDGPWIQTRHRRFEGVEEFLNLSERPQGPYEVAWVDAFAARPRGVLFSGQRPQAGRQAKPTPSLAWPLASLKVMSAPVAKAFNVAYWSAHRDGGRSLTHWRPFFCPLDNFGQWNKMYGAAGFLQFQGVVPSASARGALEAMFRRCRDRGLGSFLAVLKRFGSIPSEGALSFAREGITFAMDFPASSGASQLTRDLVAIALEAGGAAYPAKTSLQPKEFRQAYPEWEVWREQWDERGPTRSGWIERAMG